MSIEKILKESEPHERMKILNDIKKLNDIEELNLPIPERVMQRTEEDLIMISQAFDKYLNNYLALFNLGLSFNKEHFNEFMRYKKLILMLW